MRVRINSLQARLEWNAAGKACLAQQNIKCGSCSCSLCGGDFLSCSRR